VTPRPAPAANRRPDSPRSSRRRSGRILDAGHLAPWTRVKKNCDGWAGNFVCSQVHFVPGETQYFLAEAMPFLSESLRARTTAYLKDETAAYPPLRFTALPTDKGARREWYPLTAGFIDNNPADKNRINNIHKFPPVSTSRATANSRCRWCRITWPPIIAPSTRKGSPRLGCHQGHPGAALPTTGLGGEHASVAEQVRGRHGHGLRPRSGRLVWHRGPARCQQPLCGNDRAGAPASLAGDAETEASRAGCSPAGDRPLRVRQDDLASLRPGAIDLQRIPER